MSQVEDCKLKNIGELPFNEVFKILLYPYNTMHLIWIMQFLNGWSFQHGSCANYLFPEEKLLMCFDRNKNKGCRTYGSPLNVDVISWKNSDGTDPNSNWKKISQPMVIHTPGLATTRAVHSSLEIVSCNILVLRLWTLKQEHGTNLNPIHSHASEWFRVTWWRYP